MSDRWTLSEGLWLDDVVARNAAHATFEIPPESVRKGLSKGDWAKLVFYFPDGGAERMWVEVTDVEFEDDVLTYVGELRSGPFHDEPLSPGDTVRFQPHHICGKDRPPKGYKP